MEKLTDLPAQIKAGIVPYGATIRRVIAAEPTPAQKAGAPLDHEFIVFAQADGVDEQEIGVSTTVANRLKAHVGRGPVAAPVPPEPELKG